MPDIRIAQVGCGYWGRNLARNLAEISALGAVVDGNPATAAAMTIRWSLQAFTVPPENAPWPRIVSTPPFSSAKTPNARIIETTEAILSDSFSLSR